MKQSSSNEVTTLYESTADSYAAMMKTEIGLPVYTDTLSRLHERLRNLEGPLIDTSCGSGHMLQLYSERFDSDRKLIGIDLTPQMVEIAKKRLGSLASVEVGDMRSLSMIADESAAAVLSFFALHHLDMESVQDSLCEWHRVLRPGDRCL